MEDIGIKVIALDNKKSSMSMYVFLPDNYDGLAQLEANMATFNYTEIIQKMRLNYIVLSLPKFEIDFSMSLKKTLKQVMSVQFLFLT